MRKTPLLAALIASLAAPAAAIGGTAVSTVPNLPSGPRAGGAVTVSEAGVPGHVVITQTFNGADFGATARLRLIRLSVNCGPGPSPGNPGTNGPAINSPEIPCTNPDLGVFGNLSAVGSGAQQCAGASFTITAPDPQGQVDLVPGAPVDLRNADTCEINFSFSILAMPSRDTFPAAAGMQTTSVSSVRSEIITDPGNPGAVGLQAAGLGSGDAVLVQPDCTSPIPPPDCIPTLTECASLTPPPSCSTGGTGGTGGARGARAASPKLRVAGTCANNRLRASVTGANIKKVTYLIDGHVVKTVKGKAPFKLNARINYLGGGAHRVTASVTFQGSTPTHVMSKRFSRCSDPNFTG